jgi:hypothetical protein
MSPDDLEAFTVFFSMLKAELFFFVSSKSFTESVLLQVIQRAKNRFAYLLTEKNSSDIPILEIRYLSFTLSNYLYRNGNST